MLCGDTGRQHNLIAGAEAPTMIKTTFNFLRVCEFYFPSDGLPKFPKLNRRKPMANDSVGLLFEK